MAADIRLTPLRPAKPRRYIASVPGGAPADNLASLHLGKHRQQQQPTPNRLLPRCAAAAGAILLNGKELPYLWITGRCLDSTQPKSASRKRTRLRHWRVSDSLESEQRKGFQGRWAS